MLRIVPLMIETVKKYKNLLGNFDDNNPMEMVDMAMSERFQAFGVQASPANASKACTPAIALSHMAWSVTLLIA